jgi:hypothetical protein
MEKTNGACDFGQIRVVSESIHILATYLGNRGVQTELFRFRARSRLNLEIRYWSQLFGPGQIKHFNTTLCDWPIFSAHYIDNHQREVFI